jgi:regulator of protease activity HflC (stomatin/prohibitin superfamily)
MNIVNFIQILTVLIWLASVGIVGLIFASIARRRGVKGLSSLLIIMAILAVGLTTLSSGLVFIQPEERGMVISAMTQTGYREQALLPGLRWIVPFAETVITYPISKQTYTMSAVAGEGQVQGDDAIQARTLDGQQVSIDASVVYTIDPNKVVQVHIDWQNRYINDLVRPQSRGAIRDMVSQYRVEEVVSTKRVEMTDKIHQQLAAKLSENGLFLIDFVLRNVSFSQDYAASVEKKQIAEQQAQEAKYVVEQKKQEAEQVRQTAQGQADAAVIAAKGQAEGRLIQADAEAKSLTVIADALKQNQDLLTYQYINKLAPGVQVMMVPNNTPYLLPLPSLTPTPGAK